jgi:Cu/Ag efflux protein CusF
MKGKEYSHNSLKRSGFYQFVLTNKKEINIFMTNFIPANFKAKPAGLMNKLIANLGYKHESRRDGKGKKREYIYSSKTNKNFESFLNSRQERGTSWDDFTEKLFIDLDSRKELLSKADIKRLQMPSVDVRYILDKLQLIPKIKQGEVMAIYKEKYDMTNSDNQGIDAPVFANAWLQSQTV